tara:strand:- start:1365 stop:1631 length:267 start_codon:yes stop_codon:yes gene_type:complete
MTMTDEPQQNTISLEDAVRLLQVDNADKVGYLNILQNFVAGVESSLTSLRRDIAQFNAGISARNNPNADVITPEESEEASDDSEDSDE